MARWSWPGRDIYVREGCYGCHSQMIRPLRAETERYGHYSVAGESVYDHPFQFGSKRTGPDLARVGGRYSDEWHRVHLANPRDVVPESNMPGLRVARRSQGRSAGAAGEDGRAAQAGRAVHRRARSQRRRPRSTARPRWMRSSRICRASGLAVEAVALKRPNRGTRRMTSGTLSGIVTAILIGAVRGRVGCGRTARAGVRSFDAAARLPLEEDPG